MPDLKRIHKGDSIDLYLCVPICKTTVCKENMVYKVVDYHGSSLRICTSTGLPMGRKDMMAIPEHYPEDGFKELYRQLRQVKFDKLQSLSDAELYILQDIANKITV